EAGSSELSKSNGGRDMLSLRNGYERAVVVRRVVGLPTLARYHSLSTGPSDARRGMHPFSVVAIGPCRKQALSVAKNRPVVSMGVGLSRFDSRDRVLYLWRALWS